METDALWLFTFVQVALLGGFLMILPAIGRRGLLFGVYVGESASEGEEARAMRRAWVRGMAILVGLVLAAVVVAGWIYHRPALAIATQGLLAAGFLHLYLRAHFRARRLAPPGPPPATAVLVPAQDHPTLLPHLTTFVCLVLGLTAFGYVWSRFDALPDQVPTHFGWGGQPDAWGPRSFASVLLLPMFAVLMGAGLGGASYLVAGAKRALRHPDGGVSLQAQLRFRRAVTRYLCGVAVIVTAMLSVLSVSAVRVGLGLAPGLPTAMKILGAGLLLFTVGGAIYLAVRYGQGGARLEGSAASAPLTDGLADNRRWVLGMFYVNRDDPSLVVEHRFGLGYTVNLGNWRAVAVVIGFVGSILGLTAWVLLALR